MKKIKYILVLFIIILLTGCSGTYNLTINKDFSVDEKLELKVDRNDETYNRTLNLFKNNKIPSDKYKVSVTKNNVEIKYNEKYNSIEEYIINSKLYHQFFDNIDYTYKEGKIQLFGESIMYLDKSNSNNLINNYNISMLNVNIDTPFKILYSNSDSKTDNTLTWKLDNNTKEKNISMIFDVEKSRNNIREYVLLGALTVIVFGSLIVLILRFYNSKKI